MDPNEVDVARLANAWEPYAKVVEDEITAGWVAMEPTRMMWRVSAYLAEHYPIKAKQFEDRFFKQLN